MQRTDALLRYGEKSVSWLAAHQLSYPPPESPGLWEMRSIPAEDMHRVAALLLKLHAMLKLTDLLSKVGVVPRCRLALCLDPLICVPNLAESIVYVVTPCRAC